MQITIQIDITNHHQINTIFTNAHRNEHTNKHTSKSNINRSLLFLVVVVVVTARERQTSLNHCRRSRRFASSVAPLVE